ncbi:MAG: hypothetical protein AAF518_14490 [Spirochaetota bacterium]
MTPAEPGDNLKPGFWDGEPNEYTWANGEFWYHKVGSKDEEEHVGYYKDAYNFAENDPPEFHLYQYNKNGYGYYLLSNVTISTNYRTDIIASPYDTGVEFSGTGKLIHDVNVHRSDYVRIYELLQVTKIGIYDKYKYEFCEWKYYGREERPEE